MGDRMAHGYVALKANRNLACTPTPTATTHPVRSNDAVRDAKEVESLPVGLVTKKAHFLANSLDDTVGTDLRRTTRQSPTRRHSAAETRGRESRALRPWRKLIRQNDQRPQWHWCIQLFKRIKSVFYLFRSLPLSCIFLVLPQNHTLPVLEGQFSPLGSQVFAACPGITAAVESAESGPLRRSQANMIHGVKMSRRFASWFGIVCLASFAQGEFGSFTLRFRATSPLRQIAHQLPTLFHRPVQSPAEHYPAGLIIRKFHITGQRLFVLQFRPHRARLATMLH